MKRTIAKLLGIATLAMVGITGLAPEALAQSWTPYSQNGISCERRTGGANYPENGKFYYCGDPNLPVNIAQHRDGYLTNILQTVPASTRNSMATATLTNGNPGVVEILVFCTVYEAEDFFGTSLPVGANESAFFNKPTNTLIVFQWLTSNALGCAAPGKTIAYEKAYQAMDHEIGHFVDWRKNVPANQIRHSIEDALPPNPANWKLYRKYLQKDIDWINSPTNAACVTGPGVQRVFFTTPARDKFLAANGALKQVCNGTVRDPELVGLTNFQIMKKMMPYFVTEYTDLDPETNVTSNSWRELFAETYPRAIGTTSSQPAGSPTDFYLGQGQEFFRCSRRYVEMIGKNGAPPTPAQLASPYNRCVL